MIRSSTGGVQLWYQTLSGQTTAIGPAMQIRRQSALVRLTPPCLSSFSSLSRDFRYFQAWVPDFARATGGLLRFGAEENVALRHVGAIGSEGALCGKQRIGRRVHWRISHGSICSR